VLVSGELDFGAMVAAERAGLPFATVLISATETFVRDAIVAEPLAALRTANGLAPDARAEPLVLSPFPRRLRSLPAGAHGYRAAHAERASPDATTVYFTLGTIFNLESGDLFERVLAGLRELPADVIATTGANLDPDELGSQPESVRIERHLPQSEILPRCRAMVSHGGSGSILGALAHGLPSVLLPMGADQPHNAARCEQLGVARVLDAIRATPHAVREAAAEVMNHPSYRAAAELVADEIAALPGPDDAVALVERLVA
jgi:MGT family glycosyltransferase